MSDFAITRVDETIPDYTWAASRHGFDTAGSGTLNVPAFDAETHYPNGYIPSGTPVRKVGDLYEPLTEGDAEAEPPVEAATEFDAIVLESVAIRAGQTVATFAALDHGIVYGDRLRGSVTGASPAETTQFVIR